MIDRIFKSWKSTIVGLLIILGAFGAVFTEKATLIEAGTFMGVGISLFFIKDPKNGNTTG